MCVVIFVCSQEFSRRNWVGPLVAYSRSFCFGNLVDKEKLGYRKDYNPDQKHNCKCPVKAAPVIGYESTEPVEFAVPSAPVFLISHKHNKNGQQGQ